ncbi:hypothetical protein HO133_007940 [Letharia lupina]|uniref:Uncharacterized protein n=1 Tax=Letharia lupina TaxID=560253 RepID=A0A8H6CQW6_9LECA|nr:uncharacterized protein HO133_007940 [Letharia lupina]KAF6228210.1 hypothetical protein HO133_007940 [Letharia lupina]
MAISPLTESNASCSPPFTRDSSPSPSTSPTPALSACPPLSRSFSANSSTTSSVSTGSQPSITSRSVSASGAVRQRGYVRPQGVSFAPSAGNRDSVLSLGSIAHLQYYFARTGLLDGKGGQLAKGSKNKNGFEKPFTNILPRIRASPDLGGDTDGSNGSSEAADKDPGEPLMLPPTVSTYSHRVQYIPPPPDLETLRHDLKTTLADAKKALQEIQDQNQQDHEQRKLEPESDSPDVDNKNYVSSSFSQSSGWYEIQGVHILDVVTLAIRAAKIYYTSHEDPHRLYSIKSERQIREELLSVLDVLKRMAGRNFAGGMREEELRIMKDWVEGIEAFLSKEAAMDEQEKKTQDSWAWLEGSWQGREREREWLFLCSFLPEGSLPEWTAFEDSAQTPTPFLETLRSGLTLVHLHNALLKKSRRQFGDIKSFHTDTAKPYRCSENLRYWIKAAEIRWETKLKVNVSGVVNAKSGAWMDFDTAILQWSKTVREELTKEFKEETIRPNQQTMFPVDQRTGMNECNES